MSNIQESSLADVIIDILGEHAISELSCTILKSPSFRGFKTTKIHNYIKNHLSEPNSGLRGLLITVIKIYRHQKGERTCIEIQKLFLDLKEASLGGPGLTLGFLTSIGTAKNHTSELKIIYEK